MASEPADPAPEAEQRLVRAAAEGDEAAFQTLWQRHAPALFRHALRRTGQREQAEDVVQDVFVALIRRGPSYVARAPLRAWLFRIARNRIFNLWRDTRPSEPLPELPAPAAAPELVIAVREALAALPESFREPILLATYEQLSYPEIAVALGCPLGTVRSRIARGKRLLAATLEGRNP